ncbi:MAG: thiosulfate oxidation carrier complex protein SoxZ [Gammaproteobacteria bacterium]
MKNLGTKIRIQRQSGHTEIKLLVSHPMENGRNRDSISGQLIPAHFIQKIDLQLNGKTVVAAKLGAGVSKNPFFTFRLKQTNPGDRITVRWIDNLEFEDNIEHIIE